MRIKKNDKVAVISGKSKGSQGKVIRTLRTEDRVVVEKVNIVKKHIKKTREKAGERIEVEAPIHVSNIQLICPSCNKRTRIKMQVSKSGKKVRTCKKCDASVEQNFVKS